MLRPQLPVYRWYEFRGIHTLKKPTPSHSGRGNESARQRSRPRQEEPNPLKAKAGPTEFGLSTRLPCKAANAPTVRSVAGG